MLTHGKKHAGPRKWSLPKATAKNRTGFCRQNMKGEPFPSGIQPMEVRGFWQSHLSWPPLINDLIYLFSNHTNVCCELLCSSLYTCLPGPQQNEAVWGDFEKKKKYMCRKIKGYWRLRLITSLSYRNVALTFTHRSSSELSLRMTVPRVSACAGMLCSDKHGWKQVNCIC